MGQERSPAHKYGHRMVVRRPTWHVAFEVKKWQSEEKLVPRFGHHAHGLGNECPPTEFGAEYPCAYGLWIYSHGSWSCEDRGDLIRPERPEFDIREELGGDE